MPGTFEYTPYTSIQLSSGGSEISNAFTDINPFTNIPDIPSLPTGKQVIFFSLGMLCLIAALALIEKTLITEAAPELLNAAKTALV